MLISWFLWFVAILDDYCLKSASLEWLKIVLA